MTLMPDRTIVLESASFAGVTLVGAGPGDPDLVTVAGLNALSARTSS
jgi:uroporphyrin-III C-methyltransferase / precorrin-2 dehydrogenase / sirohydrochlorin ferrochelatase